ncbi:WXG100 family type VII secretion target [Butyrivibrio sp. NC2002]|uniref:WXG100 family type VII secretion target n=1 Tax=Butyrivibrio sp. NC2002 TaxID=1410610 RepID=UPI00056453F2|nr:WXG100 family type VII secretion target [Butyrivibrio sp. NC2002]
MAILKALKVTDVADLRTEASNFRSHASDVQKKTQEMLTLVEQTNSVWRGDARTKYATQFQGLQDDMTRLFKTCDEYGEDLEKIATNYENAENDNVQAANALKADIALV